MKCFTWVHFAGNWSSIYLRLVTPITSRPPPMANIGKFQTIFNIPEVITSHIIAFDGKIAQFKVWIIS